MGAAEAGDEGRRTAWSSCKSAFERVQEVAKLLLLDSKQSVENSMRQ